MHKPEIDQAADGTWFVRGEFDGVIADDFDTREEAEAWLDHQRETYFEERC